ncbi:hypothetical protein GCM10011502_29980 [Oceanisphaera marina]|uniref:Plasmid replication protein RepB n=1 Tax=Oceanisphaera marina TaxID=2017550 RepID=A0ABQ1IZB9_9GAMM|nr:hypothetical protein [Oceanisphaera marina]GGB55023.1 hypothetical protein GCM10011502_29980 [Oceanisphaera marina]
MRIDQLRLLFDAGDLQSCVLLPAVLDAGPAPRWVLHVKRRNGALVALCLNRKKNGVEVERLFHSLDAAFQAARDIGFIEVRVRG